ncbi:MAG TPA: radical SAM protein [Flavobacteriaceae bacterium]|nr:radical SAM protein [Flavobacteriaceae bacterium]HIP26088.1 radical SAM protein [Flavobacteriaceae bacterium]
MNKRRLKKAFRRIYYLPMNKNLFLYLGNKIKGFYYKATKSTKVAYPSTIMLELTNQCNLACTICPREYLYGKQMDKGMMNIDEAKKIIDEVHPYLDSIGLTGMGETFMFKQIAEVVDYIKNKNKGIIISISTNAVLPNFIEKVKPVINKIDTIQISIDGLDEVYDSIRLKSDFKLLDKNLKEIIQLCKGTSTELMLNMVVTKENYLHMPRLVTYAENVGIDYLDFTLFNLASVTDIPITYYEFYESKEFLSVVDELDQAIEKTNNVIITNRNFKTENSFQKCNFPWNHFYVSQDGYVPPCCAKPFPKEKNFGNTKNTTLLSVLNSLDYRKWRELWYKNEAPDFCEKCHLIDLKPINKENNNS